MGDDNSIVDELKEAFKDLGIPETSVADNETPPQPQSKPKSTPGGVKPASSFDPEKINEVIFLEKQVVEPERLNAIQASISKWANGIPHHDLTDLGNKIKLTSVYERPAYLVTLHTQHETRELKNGEYPGDEIPPLKVIKIKSVDVWDIDVPLVEDFVDKQINYIIEGSNKVFECGGCDGHGEVDCNRCNSSGVTSCSKCAGHGNIRCSTCKGSGEIKCSSCSGRGEKLCIASFVRLQNCIICSPFIKSS